MSVNVTFLGQTYTIPTTGEEDWGDDLTAFLVALGNNSASGVSLTSVGAAPNANGASISGTVLNLQPSDATHPGVNTILAQTYAGVKTFSSSPVLSTASHVRATSASGQSIPNNTPTTLVFGTETYDTQSEYDPTTGIFTAKEAGYYLVQGAYILTADAPTAGDRAIASVYLNGANFAIGQVNIANSTTSQSLNSRVGTVLHLAVNDTIVISASQLNATTAARTLVASALDNYFTVDRLF